MVALESVVQPPEDPLHRFSLAVRTVDGDILGTGILVGENRVLTCAHVVRDLQKNCNIEQVEVAIGSCGASLSSAKVIRRGSWNGADDLALLELEKPLRDRAVVRFAEPRRGEGFQCVGFPGDQDFPGDLGQAHGKVQGPSGSSGWLKIDALGSRRIVPGFSGGAVWSEERGVVVGLITHHIEGDGVAYAIPTAEIRRFYPELFPAPPKDPKQQCHQLISRVKRQLKDQEVLEAILEADPVGDWREIAKLGAAALADALCLETKPEDLVEGLCQAFCDVEAERGLDGADKIFDVLVEALPAAVLSHWPLEWPDGSSREVQIGLVNRVLIEFVMAASEGAAASFHRQIGPSSEEEPWAIHRIPEVGELGPDPAGEEGAGEVAQDLMTRSALSPMTDLQKKEHRFLAQLATYHPTQDSVPFVPATTREELKRSYPKSEGGLREKFLKILNQGLSQRSMEGKRYFYFIAEKDNPLVDGLRRSLPDLKIVTLPEKSEEIVETHTLLRRLWTVFKRRHKKEGPKK